MRNIPISLLLVFLGCGGSSVVQSTQQSAICSGSDVPIYHNRFSPQSGASGVATAPEAAAGIISSDAPLSASAGADSTTVSTGAIPTALPATGGASVPTTPAAVPSGGSGSATDLGAPLTAMDVGCGQAACAPGEVAVEVPPTVGGGGVGTAGPAVTAGLSTTTGSAAPAAAPTADPALASVPAASASSSGGSLACAEPPPSCPAGQSPQFTSKRTWECTDCSLVVTYGGIYGNYRRCVDMPDIACPAGEVPTWVFEDEEWECKTKCDNGQYDQHTVQGMLVCVPC
jgi:hypothetical protein